MVRPVGSRMGLLLPPAAATIAAAASTGAVLGGPVMPAMIVAVAAALGAIVASIRLHSRWSELEGRLTAAQRDYQVTEDALQHSTDVLRSMVSALPVGVVTVDRDGRVETWNQAAESILGYSAREMLGQPAPAYVFLSYPDNRSASDVFLRMVTGELVKGEEVRCRRKDGSAVDTTLSGAPLVGEDQRLRGAICVFEDISHRKLIATQLQQAQKMEAVGQLTGGMAHDFNNILGVAIGNLDLLEVELADRSGAAELVETALNALLRGAELTRALLAFARRQPLKPVRVDASQLLASVTRMLSRTLGEHIRIGLHVEGQPWPIMVDPAQLESAITNLAINARDAMPKGGTLSISARNMVLEQDYVAHGADAGEGDHLLIEITDTGSGMSQEVLARVFEPFFTTKAVGQGTGLGLSMVFGFINQSGGHIRIYSEVGHGTTVRLYLPRAAEDSEASAPARKSDTMPGGSERVLVVEDNIDVRRMVVGQLGRLGYQVTEAENGPTALALLDGPLQVDLLFTDVVMPEGVTGFQLAEEAQRRRPGLKVLVTSGFPGGTAGSPSEGEGKWAFLGKPYRKQDLASAVRDVLDAKESNS